MTEFMLRIHDLARPGRATSAPRPALEEATFLSTGMGAHEQVENRAYAEQLVCEANAILAPAGLPTIELHDLCGTVDQVFTVRVGRQWAQFATRFDGGRSRSELIGSSVPDWTSAPVKLVDAAALEDFIVELVADSIREVPADLTTPEGVSQ